jgi:hypothetical protein
MRFRTQVHKTRQAGEFPLKGRKPEQIAVEWLYQISKEGTWVEEVYEVLANGEDITEKVIKLREAPFN